MLYVYRCENLKSLYLNVLNSSILLQNLFSLFSELEENYV
jgi:hypothetical protein